MACYRKGLWEECYAAASNALKITNKEAVYTMDPTVWGALPHDLLALAAHNLGMKEKAIEQGEIALKLEPQNERFIANLAYYRK
jgi:Flp pilus assembly protein TadD